MMQDRNARTPASEDQLRGRAMNVVTALETLPLLQPFTITGHTFHTIDVLRVEVECEGYRGAGEAAGVYFKGDVPAGMAAQIDSVLDRLKKGVSRADLQQLLPPGGARNALDCALWDLEAHMSGVPAWQAAGLDEMKPLLTTFGCGADAPEAMAAVARGYTEAKAIKLKLTGEPLDRDRVIAVREARPDVWLSVDANQGFTASFLEELMPCFIETDVKLIEQPFPVGEDDILEETRFPIQIAADESVIDRRDIDQAARRYDIINIKLDKCGGLTEALAMADKARNLGLGVMVGNMIGTSLAMAPACVLGQLCDVVDLDGPLFLRDPSPFPVSYSGGLLTSPSELWGYPA